MSELLGPLGKQIVNTWDGDGNLTKVALKDSGGVVRSTTEYDWDTYSSLVTKTDDNDNQTSYEHGSNVLRRNSEYPLYDGHGSERTVTASDRSVTGTINFEAFGQTVGTSGSSSSPYMYAGAWGYRSDGDAGLMHVGARYYDAQVGRFITRHTVLSEHPYLYCEHDSVNAVDPSGHEVPTRRFWYWFGVWGCIGMELYGGCRRGHPAEGLIVAVLTFSWAYGGDTGGPLFEPDPIGTGPIPYYGADTVGPTPSGSFAAVYRGAGSQWCFP